MKKIIISAVALTLLAASCSFGPTTQVGIVKTANGGVDWQSANRVADTEKTLLERSISELKFNFAGDKLYASSFDSGLFSSDDAAENWTELLPGIPIYDFAFDPFDDQVIYAAVYLAEKGRVFVTRDGARSWTEVYSDAGNNNPVRAIAVNPANPSEVLIGTGRGSIIISRDAGSSWQLLQNYDDRINRIYWEGSTIYIIAQRQGVYKSITGGASFERMTRNLRQPGQDDFFGFGGQVGDYRRLAINPNNPQNLLLTTDRGLFWSSDGGTSWNYDTMPFRQQDASPFAVSFAPSSSNVIYVSSTSVILKSTDGGRTWTSSDTGTNGLVTTILVSNNLPQMAFAGVSK